MSQIEIKFLKDKMKLFEGTVTQTQFGQGFGFKNTTTGFINSQQQETDQKLVQVNSEHLKRLSLDPVAHFLETVNKITFLCNLPPTLNKDPRLVHIEAFYRVNFGGKQQGALIKSEILKLQNGSKEYMGQGMLAKVTYEALLQQMEDLLMANRYYE